MSNNRNMLHISWEEFAPYLFTEGKQKRTRKDLKPRFNQIERYFKDKDFNRMNVIRWFDELLAGGRRHSTVNNLLKIIIHCCNYLVFTGKIEKNFMDGFQYFEEQPCDLDVLTDEEVEQIKNCFLPRSRDADYINFRWSLIIEVLSMYVFRIGEVAMMEWGKHYKDGIFIIDDGKTFSSAGKLEVLPYLQEKINKLRRYSNHNYVFGSVRGKLDDASFSEELKKRLKACEINKRITPHSLRRSGITNYIEKDVNQFKLIKVTRHKNFNSLNRYNHLAYKAATEVLESHPSAAPYLSYDSIKKKVLHFYDTIKDAPCQKTLEQDEDYITVTIRRSDLKKFKKIGE